MDNQSQTTDQQQGEIETPQKDDPVNSYSSPFQELHYTHLIEQSDSVGEACAVDCKELVESLKGQSKDKIEKSVRDFTIELCQRGQEINSDIIEELNLHKPLPEIDWNQKTLVSFTLNLLSLEDQKQFAQLLSRMQIPIPVLQSEESEGQNQRIISNFELCQGLEQLNKKIILSQQWIDLSDFTKMNDKKDEIKEVEENKNLLEENEKVTNQEEANQEETNKQETNQEDMNSSYSMVVSDNKQKEQDIITTEKDEVKQEPNNDTQEIQEQNEENSNLNEKQISTEKVGSEDNVNLESQVKEEEKEKNNLDEAGAQEEPSKNSPHSLSEEQNKEEDLENIKAQDLEKAKPENLIANQSQFKLVKIVKQAIEEIFNIQGEEIAEEGDNGDRDCDTVGSLSEESQESIKNNTHSLIDLYPSKTLLQKDITIFKSSQQMDLNKINYNTKLSFISDLIWLEFPIQVITEYFQQIQQNLNQRLELIPEDQQKQVIIIVHIDPKDLKQSPNITEKLEKDLQSCSKHAFNVFPYCQYSEKFRIEKQKKDITNNLSKILAKIQENNTNRNLQWESIIDILNLNTFNSEELKRVEQIQQANQDEIQEILNDFTSITPYLNQKLQLTTLNAQLQEQKKSNNSAEIAELEQKIQEAQNLTTESQDPCKSLVFQIFSKNLNGKKLNITNEQIKRNISRDISKVKALKPSISDNQLNFYTALNEMQVMMSANHNSEQFSTIREAIREMSLNHLSQGDCLQFIDSKSISFGNEILKEIMELKFGNTKYKDVKVVSVLGGQSTGKSTMLNQSFGCSFKTGDGKCTHGMYFSTRAIDEETLLIIVDTEGLASVDNSAENGQQEQILYDNRIALMVFLISDIIIFHCQGEISSSMSNMLEMSTFALHQFKLKLSQESIPKFLVTSRGTHDSKSNEEIYLGITNQLAPKLKNFGIELNDYIDFSLDGIHSFTDAYVQNSNKMVNQLYASQAAKFKKYCVSLVLKNKNYKHNFQSLYDNLRRSWELVLTNSNILLNSQNLTVFERKEQANTLIKEYSYKKIVHCNQKISEIIQSLEENALDNNEKYENELQRQQKMAFQDANQFFENNIDSEIYFRCLSHFLPSFKEQIRESIKSQFSKANQDWRKIIDQAQKIKEEEEERRKLEERIKLEEELKRQHEEEENSRLLASQSPIQELNKLDSEQLSESIHFEDEEEVQSIVKRFQKKEDMEIQQQKSEEQDKKPPSSSTSKITELGIFILHICIFFIIFPFRVLNFFVHRILSFPSSFGQSVYLLVGLPRTVPYRLQSLKKNLRSQIYRVFSKT